MCPTVHPTYDNPNAVKKIKMHYLFFLVTFAYSAHAQVILSGSVKGAAEEPLIGASILIKDTIFRNNC